MTTRPCTTSWSTRPSSTWTWCPPPWPSWPPPWAPCDEPQPSLNCTLYLFLPPTTRPDGSRAGVSMSIHCTLSPLHVPGAGPPPAVHLGLGDVEPAAARLHEPLHQLQGDVPGVVTVRRVRWPAACSPPVYPLAEPAVYLYPLAGH